MYLLSICWFHINMYSFLYIHFMTWFWLHVVHVLLLFAFVSGEGQHGNVSTYRNGRSICLPLGVRCLKKRFFSATRLERIET